MDFYYVKNNERFGPTDIEGLKGNITPKTKVWHEGLADWQDADQVEALIGFFATTPPMPPVEKVMPTSIATMPKTWLVESIIATVLCCLPFGIVGIVYSSKVEGEYLSGNVQLAAEHSRLAKRWTIAGFITGGSFFLLYILFMVVCIMIGASSGL